MYAIDSIAIQSEDVVHDDCDDGRDGVGHMGMTYIYILPYYM